MEEQKGSARWAPVIAGVVVLAVALAAIAAFVSSPESNRSASVSKAEAERGTACAALLDAQQSVEDGNASETGPLILRARAEAVKSLNEGGNLFGKPEKLALRLGSVVEENDGKLSAGEVTEGLNEASEACSRLQSS